MRRTARMDINSRSKLRETKRSSGVIKMDMAEKHMTDVARANTHLFQPRDHILKCRFRPGIEYNHAIGAFERNHRYYSASAELDRVDNVRLQGEPTNTGKASRAMWESRPINTAPTFSC